MCGNKMHGIKTLYKQKQETSSPSLTGLLCMSECCSCQCNAPPQQKINSKSSTSVTSQYNLAALSSPRSSFSYGDFQVTPFPHSLESPPPPALN